MVSERENPVAAINSESGIQLSKKLDSSFEMRRPPQAAIISSQQRPLDFSIFSVFLATPASIEQRRFLALVN